MMELIKLMGFFVKKMIIKRPYITKQIEKVNKQKSIKKDNKKLYSKVKMIFYYNKCNKSYQKNKKEFQN